jgi:predicted small lipoprotein YifL
MLHRILTFATLAAMAALAACSDRTPITPPDAEVAGVTAVRKPERLARQFAKALRNPAFRAYLKAQLDASPFPEHKLQFQAFLGASGGRALRHLAEENGEAPADVEREARAAIALEVYLPVPAHRTAWTGDDNILVATGITDRDVPVAFDTRGGRHLLDPDTPPAETPVLALVPVETDFIAGPQRMDCMEDCGGGGGGSGDVLPPPPPPPGLYMTKAHFVQDFEGWLKGAPEFEVHILGQKGATDSLLSYQCAGERQYGPYYFNQDDLNWSGRVLLFSKQQLDQYNAAHPGQNVRVFVVEDDDTPCTIKTDPARFQHLITAVDSAYRDLTAGNDSSSVVERVYRYAKVAENVWEALASFFKSNDELVGNAVQDVIVGQFYPGYNWFVKGDNTITNGWINLVMY